jgi:hypothetical protein
VAISEEREFLSNYNIPFVQLDPFKSILVFAHDHNSVNKEMLLENAHPEYIRPTNLKVSHFILDEDIKDFYMNRLPEALKTYDIGRPESKPEVMKQIEEIKRVRDMQLKEMQLKESMENFITLTIGNEPPRKVSKQEIVQILQQQHEYINQLTSLLQGKDMEIELLNDTLSRYIISV